MRKSIQKILLLIALAIFAPFAQAADVLTPLYDFMSNAPGTEPEGQLVKVGADYFGYTTNGGAFDRGIFYKLSRAGASSTRTTLASFNESETTDHISSLLVAGSDGNIYYTASDEGVNGDGAIYKITTAGVRTLVHSFYSDVDGSSPQSLLLATDGNFYGVTQSGSTDYRGAIFKMTPTGVVSVLYRFGRQDFRVVGDSPATLVQSADGNLYGTTNSGGMSGNGLFFKITTSGVFTPLLSAGRDVSFRVIENFTEAATGIFYGVQGYSGPSGEGQIIKLTRAGVFSVVHTFDSTNGGTSNPNSMLAKDSNGNLYGTTADDYSYDSDGVFYRISSTDVYSELHRFDSFTEGSSDFSFRNLCSTGAGSFLQTRGAGGDVAVQGGAILEITTSGNVAVLSGFVPGNNDAPVYPIGGLTAGPDGALYLITKGGGINDSGVFLKLNSVGQPTKLYDFGGDSSSYPFSKLTLGRDNNFYGTSQYGGTYNSGSIYKITPTGVLTDVYSFNYETDGDDQIPLAMQATDGIFYGTTSNGGSNSDGSIYKITTAGVYIKLHDFDQSREGSKPDTLLVQGNDGLLYGTTSETGFYNRGTIYRIATSGTGFTTLHDFISNVDGSPSNGLLKATDGQFYATTQLGGTNNFGTIYRIDSSGVFTVLHTFSGGAGGGSPTGQLVQTANGEFYGVTQAGGANDSGVLFKITTAGTYTVLQSLPANYFNGSPSPLTVASDGSLYGITTQGGAYGVGSIFRFTSIADPVPVPTPLPLPVQQFKITLKASPAAKGSVRGGGNFASNTVISVVATPKAGKKFVSWTAKGKVVSKKSRYTFNVTQARNLVANFK